MRRRMARVQFRARRPARSRTSRSTQSRTSQTARRPSLFNKRANTGKARIGKMTKTKIKKKKIRGSIFETESSGVVTGTTNRRYPVILGHISSPAFRVYFAVVRAVVKLLAQKLDIDFKSWDEYVAVTRVGADTTGPQAAVSMTIYYQYQTAADSDLLEGSHDVLTRQSWDKVALDLADKWKNIMNDDAVGGEADLFRLEKIWVQMQSQSTTTSDSIKEEPRAVMNAKDIKVFVDCQSRMTIQNRTPAVTVGTEETTNRNDIAANPLIGKCYNMTAGYANLCSVNAITGGGPGSDIFSTQQGGAIFGDLSGMDGSAQRQFYSIPSERAFSNVNKSYAVSLIPGNCKTSFTKYSKKMRLNTFLYKIRPSVRLIPDGTTTNTATDVPHFRMATGKFYLLRKSLHDGSTDDPFPVVAWQVQARINAFASHKRSVYTCTFKEDV